MLPQEISIGCKVKSESWKGLEQSQADVRYAEDRSGLGRFRLSLFPFLRIAGLQHVSVLGYHPGQRHVVGLTIRYSQLSCPSEGKLPDRKGHISTLRSVLSSETRCLKEKGELKPKRVVSAHLLPGSVGV